MSYLLDTNVLSEIIKKRPEPRLMQRLTERRHEPMMTSVICVFELRHGASRHPHGTRLWSRIENEVLPLVEVLPLGNPEATRAGELLAELEHRGMPIGLEDLLIGATGLVNDLVVVTRNLRHLKRIPGLRVESWWS